MQKERLDTLMREIERDIAQAQDPDGKERLLMTFLVKAKDSDEEARFLKEKARCLEKDKTLFRDLNVNQAYSRHSLRDSKDIARRIKVLAQFTEIRKPQEIIVL